MSDVHIVQTFTPEKEAALKKALSAESLERAGWPGALVEFAQEALDAADRARAAPEDFVSRPLAEALHGAAPGSTEPLSYETRPLAPVRIHTVEDEHGFKVGALRAQVVAARESGATGEAFAEVALWVRAKGGCSMFFGAGLADCEAMLEVLRKVVRDMRSMNGVRP